MKTLIARTFFSGSTVAVLALAGVCSLQNSNAQPQPDPAVAETAVQPATPVTPPPDLSPASPLAQVVRLAQAGVDPGVIMTYITNSSSTFNLDSEKIIYASDAGVPSTMVTAMMQRDQFLQQQFAAEQAAQQTQQTQPTQTAPPPETGPASTTEAAAQPETPPAPVTVNYFYDSLSPYGSWVVVNGYGRCWRPTVCVYNPGWQPYCDRGHWVYTDCGWYWSSDYAWGATFHYGRWFLAAGYGWCWYPNTVWAPSWVTWRYSNNYCGWAPLPPGTTYQTGVGIVYNGGNVSVGFSFGLGASCFTFVPTQYFCSSHPRNYCVAPSQVTQVYNTTTVINNYNYNNHSIVNRGIPAQNIASATRTTIRPVPVQEVNSSAAHGRYGYALGANHPAYKVNSSPSTQPFTATRTYSPQAAGNQNPQPNRNWNTPQNTQTEHNNAAATQQTQPPTSYPAVHGAPVQTPPANYSQPPAPGQQRQSAPTGTPRSMTHYSEGRQNYSEPSAGAAPAQSQSGGYHGGNQNWPGH